MCELEECTNPRLARGLCRKHYKRLMAHGDPRAVRYPRGEEHPAWKGGTYRTAHLRVEKSKGPARDYACLDCGSPAHEWSLRHEAEDVRYGANGPYDSAFSDDNEDYAARCVPCHRAYDRRDPLAAV